MEYRYRHDKQDMEEMLFNELRYLRDEVRKMRQELDSALHHVVGLASYAEKVNPGTAAAHQFTQKLKDL